MAHAKELLDPEEIMRRKFRAKCRFKAIVRLVIENLGWLSQSDESGEVDTDNVRTRVARAVRRRAKKKGLLSLNDKALLNKPAALRTDAEKHYLYRIIGGLKCFRRYPAHVKKKLAGVTYFKYYGPGRDIVRQHHEAHALYFLVSGEISITQMVFDELIKEDVKINIGLMHAGDIFGEVSLLHNIPRTATCTTNIVCEMLVLLKEDFKNVLEASVQKQWDEVRQAMNSFNYFDAFDEIEFRMKKGFMSLRYVYKGLMSMGVLRKSASSLESYWKSEMVARREGCIIAKMKSYTISSTIYGDGVGIPNYVYFILSGQCQMIETLKIITTKHLGKTFYRHYIPKDDLSSTEEEFDFEQFFSKYAKRGTLTSDRETSSIDASNIAGCAIPMNNGVLSKEESKITTKDKSIDVVKRSDQTVSMIEQMYSQVNAPPIKPVPNLQTYFMQVCLMNAGCCFGFGENMKNRRIIALTPVDCMLLPKIWLLQRNTANIWSRIKHFLDRKIPSTEKLFKEFVMSRKWMEYKDSIVEEVVSRGNTVNWTTIHDVPYSIRIEEQLEM